ncbi:MAG TPA: hypothetical protein PLS46_01335 [Microthrixaceae bacterium]|jgi:uncharacterized membrane protein YkoI|nr:hypothetical protein [Rhodoglobus sp.]HQF92771.1 hypothetical protein [Microthrixaceae bacterium]
MEFLRKKLGSVAVGGALLLGGAAGAYALTGNAGAQDTTTTSAAASSQDTTSAADDGTTTDPGGPRDGAMGPHTANGITETVLTGDDLAKATSAAEAAVSGGTVERAETDAEGAAFEVHMTKADGSHVTVKLDADFKVTSTEDGMR